jgi:hypothetical protein
LANGYSPLPLRPNRLPLPNGWDRLRHAPLTLDEIDEIVGTSRFTVGLGVVGGYCHAGNYLVPVDVDTDEPAIVDAIASVLPPANVVRIGSKGWGALYRSRTPIAGRKFRPSGKAPLVEILTTGMMVLPPTPHPKLGGAPYRWGLPATLFDTGIEQLVEITPQHIVDLEEALRPWCQKREKAATTTVVDQKLIDDKRWRAFAISRLHNEAAKFSRLSEGRYHALNAAAITLAKFVHHRHLTNSEVHGALMDACTTNGFVRKYTRSKCEEWITRGLDYGSRYGLPDLDQLPGVRPWRPSRWEQYEQMAAR